MIWFLLAWIRYALIQQRGITLVNRKYTWDTLKSQESEKDQEIQTNLKNKSEEKIDSAIG